MDTKGERFYVLYREQSAVNNQQPAGSRKLETGSSSPKVTDIRKTIDSIKTDEDGHTTINEGETHKIDRDE